jgi:hypothetical protein
MLVAGYVQRKGSPHLTKRLVATGLRPAAAVGIGNNSVIFRILIPSKNL